MDTVHLPRSAQVVLALVVLIVTVVLLAFTALNATLVVALALALAVGPPLAIGALTRAHTTMLADRLGTDVARAAQKPLPSISGADYHRDSDGWAVVVVEPGSAWREARQRVEQEVAYVRLHGQTVAEQELVTDHGKPHLNGRRISNTHREMLTNQLVRLREVRAAITARAPGDDAALKLEADAENIRRRIYEVVGSAITGVDVDALRARPELDRYFTAVAECENGHLGTPDVLRVYVDAARRQRVIRACQHCPSIWSEKV